jgi:diguanylate cyclase (GGDEF)-like protein
MKKEKSRLGILKSVWTAAVAYFGDGGVPSDVRRRINVSLLTARAKQSVVIACIGILVGGAVYVNFMNVRKPQLMQAAFVSVVAMYLVLIRHSIAWLRVDDKRAMFVPYMRSFIAILFGLGSGWGLVLITTVEVATPGQKGLIYALAIGLISTMMISGPMRYSFAFWVPITIGSFVAISSANGQDGNAIFILLACYSMITMFAIITVNKKMFDRELNLFEIKSQNETIGLFLTDFQEGTGSFVWETDGGLHLLRSKTQHGFAQSCVYDDDITHFHDVLKAVQYAVPGDRRVTETGSLTQIVKRMEQHQPFKELVVFVTTKIGARWWAISGKPIFNDEHEFVGYRGICSDVTERESYKQRIEFSADRDYLTKTYNRSSFNRILNDICQSPQIVDAALLCLDLDHFKMVNDNFGHVVGDELLTAVSERILKCVRLTDYVFRLGGDEFAVLVTDGGLTEAASVARRIIEKISEPFPGPQVSLQIGVSVGIALVPDHGRQPDTLHRKADTALYKSKGDGRGRFIVYDHEFDQRLEYEQSIETELTHALDRGQFSVAYQPVVALETSGIVGAEALLRWEHPVYGIVPPGQFIPTLEKGGQIAAVGLFVMNEAMRVAARIPDSLVIAINLSSIQLADVGLPQKIVTIMQKHKVSPRQIEFEVTESSLLQKDSLRLGVLTEIKRLGFQISLDDFGTGYSSLRLLDEFHFDILKIDASFIQNVAQDARRRVILQSIIELGRNLELVIAGEGIETRAQMEQLASLGCRRGQGFLFHEPLAEAQFVALFDKFGFKRLYFTPQGV